MMMMMMMVMMIYFLWFEVKEETISLVPGFMLMLTFNLILFFID